jgi:hypothetical protein
MINIFQLNVNHCAAAQSLLFQTARERNADVMLLSEPYAPGVGNSGVLFDSTSKAAIICCRNYYIEDQGSVPMRGIAYAKVKGVHLYSCYAPPSDSPDLYEELLNNLVHHARGRNPVVIAGDFNAWAIEWGSRISNPRGRALIDAMNQLDLVLLNDGGKPTFNNDRGTSFIDVTFVSSSLAPTAKWMVQEDVTLSDHALITFSARTSCITQRQARSTLGQAWDIKKLDRDMLAFNIEQMELPNGHAEIMVAALMKMLEAACDAAMPRKKKTSKRKPPVYWWNGSLNQLRSECLRARRLAQRARGHPQHAELHEAYRSKRAELRNGIAAAKANAFKELLASVDEDPWGIAYKMVSNKLKAAVGGTPQDPVLLSSIVEELFPNQDTLWQPAREIPAPDFPGVTECEIIEAAKRIKPNKAPGLDGIPGVVVMAAANAKPAIFKDTFQQCLIDGVFPSRWKNMRLVLLQKGKGPNNAAGSYRPLCLLDIVGKLFERVLYTRIEVITESPVGLHRHQYGFRKGKSTLDALTAISGLAKTALDGDRWLGGSKEYCAIITLDVKNAFNTARWPNILGAMRNMGIPRYLMVIIGSYFRDRILWYDTDAGPRKYHVSAGVPQGSVLGPILWNIMYDGILSISKPSGVELLCFADDVAVAAVAKTLPELQDRSNAAISTAINWLEKAGLSIAAHKSEAVLLSSRKAVESLRVTVKDAQIESVGSLKYLGVLIDHRLSFKEHARYASRKAAMTAAALARLMPNIGGPRMPARRLLVAVAKSSLLYAAPIWRSVTHKVSYLDNARAVSRTLALRLIRGFRTISEDAAHVLAGIPPIDLEIEAQYLTREGVSREEIRDWLYGVWQTRWQDSQQGRWTYQLIPDLSEWAGCEHKAVDYHLSQFLTDHGCFRSYLFRFRHVDSALCLFCSDSVESAEHILLHCARFRTEREILETLVGTPLSPRSLMRIMLADKTVWDRAHGIIVGMMKRVRIDETASRPAG